MAISKEDVLEYISGLSVLELSELVKQFEEKFGVSAQPVAVAGAAVAVEAVEEQTEFDVIILDAGEKKINVIKEIRALTGLGLKEAKEAYKSILIAEGFLDVLVDLVFGRQIAVAGKALANDPEYMDAVKKIKSLEKNLVQIQNHQLVIEIYEIF
jgi:large subunit ribosomal protein L7/L12